METKLLKPHQIDQAVTLLSSGEIVAIPTETVYGLAADAKNDVAIKKIFMAKNRPINHPLIVHVDSFNNILQWTNEIPEAAYKLSELFWPGPLTMLFNKKLMLANYITGDSTKIAIRIPDNKIALKVIKGVGGSLVAPSANSYKKLSPTKAEHVMKDLANKIAAVLDGGPCSVGIESTIIDLTTKIPKIMRPGSITKLMIENALELIIPEYQQHNEKIPGNVEEHYQPNTPTFLMNLSEIEKYIQESKEANVAVMHYSMLRFSNKISSYPIASDRLGFAKNMYDILHQIDKSGFELILIEQPPNHSNWSDINDRLYKSSHKNKLNF